MREYKDIYEAVAEECGTTLENAKAEMENFLAELYSSPNEFADSVPRNDDVPTPEEFILHVIRSMEEGK